MNLGEFLSKLRELQKQHGDNIVVSIHNDEYEVDFELGDCYFVEAYKPQWVQEGDVVYRERIVLQ